MWTWVRVAVGSDAKPDSATPSTRTRVLVSRTTALTLVPTGLGGIFSNQTSCLGRQCTTCGENEGSGTLATQARWLAERRPAQSALSSSFSVSNTAAACTRCRQRNTSSRNTKYIVQTSQGEPGRRWSQQQPLPLPPPWPSCSFRVVVPVPLEAPIRCR